MSSHWSPIYPKFFLVFIQTGRMGKLQSVQGKYKVLLLEGIHEKAIKFFEDQGMEVESLKGALDKESLKKKIPQFHIVGVRSKTKLIKEVLQSAENLLCVGCFCIGTDQTDLDFAMESGIPVFNSPFMNTRSVAELVIAEMIMLLRKIPQKNSKLHHGEWDKTSKGCHEIRGKTLGIIGYGHVGSQLSVLAQSLGMIVSFYDVKYVPPIGNATAVSLDKLLSENLFISLHVPKKESTKHMIAKEQIQKMQKGAYLINAARGNVIVGKDVAEALESGHLAGAAVDVFDVEPEDNGKNCFKNVLQNRTNTILTPHVRNLTFNLVR
jgi:D-3-phosphoglycerate dehydrogenase / 2-oxoglutarate reductase